MQIKFLSKKLCIVILWACLILSLISTAQMVHPRDLILRNDINDLLEKCKSSQSKALYKDVEASMKVTVLNLVKNLKLISDKLRYGGNTSAYNSGIVVNGTRYKNSLFLDLYFDKNIS